MAMRDMITINRSLCNGCGKCTTACAEGALGLDDENRAVLLRDIYCDGLGACLNVCATGALTITQQDCNDYDAHKTAEHIRATRENHQKHHHKEHEDCACPGSSPKSFKKKRSSHSENCCTPPENSSELTQWPIQLQLVSSHAPCFHECDLLVAADCSAFACGAFHSSYLKGKQLVIACPKLDNTDTYTHKLSEIIANNIIYSLTVVIMSVPCCSGLYHLVQKAVVTSEKNIAIRKIVLSLDGA